MHARHTAMSVKERPQEARARATAPFRDTPRDQSALLIIDMISTLEFPEADKMLPAIRSAALAIAKLRAAADRQRIPVIYINDNFGEWHSERFRLVERALQNARAVDIVSALAPRDGDYFIIKPQFSGFYATNLPVLLPKLGVDRLVLTGMAADVCVLFTAADAHMRDYRLWIPSDAVCAMSSARKRWSLQTAHASMGAETRPTSKLTLSKWRKN
ncbi:isochorismatase family cysteine hydrolase [Sphingomonas sp. AP4-R1]|uniref:isochorismatase family cysteine hydrolase n=1 Tax=Sphingomonas sp. AP4-R1 TaxID=2735134 RepID=UPI0020A3EB77|nr:isochorismatase family cysteine hydrolase [Sphingomonas sp. AP4-R1]